MNETNDTGTDRPVAGRVKWFDPMKGFGFVVADDLRSRGRNEYVTAMDPTDNETHDNATLCAPPPTGVRDHNNPNTHYPTNMSHRLARDLPGGTVQPNPICEAARGTL